MLVVLGFLFVLAGLFALALQRFYSSVPAKELKRLAARGDHLAAALYGPVAYGRSLRFLLWFLTGVLMTVGLQVAINNLPGLAAFTVVLISLAALVTTQTIRLTVRSAKIAEAAAPALTWLLTYTHAPFDFLSQHLNTFRKHNAHSGLYEKEDLLALLKQQREQADNRIAHHDLELLERAAQFDNRQAADIVVPMSRAKLVKADDHLGPMLLAELHASGQNSFLVYDGTPDHVVGTLFLRDAVAAKNGGLVSNLMHARLAFVHEDFSLRQVLKAFTHTGQFMVVVINAFEEPVGVITLQQLLTQLVGEPQEGEDFDRYDDRAAVAAFKPLQLIPQPVLQPVEVTEDLPLDGEPIDSVDESTEAASPEETEVVK